MKKLRAVILTAVMAVSLSGCGSIFDKEYVSVSSYEPPAAEVMNEEKILVSDYGELKKAILRLVYEGSSEGSIRFDPGYKGDSTEDMASACWEIRSQDALCAYCVENIAYDLTKIVNYYEAGVYISYVGQGREAENVLQLKYSSGVEEYIEEAFSQGSSSLAVLIERSSYTAEGMENLASCVYRNNPGTAPQEPRVSVNMFSGSGIQRLYEINISYGMSSGELESRRRSMEALKPFEALDTENLSEAGRALAAGRYILENCEYNSDGSSIYSALVEKSADSEGLSLAYVELCRQLKLECMMVYGQYNLKNYCWNIVKVDGRYYHVDIGKCLNTGLESAFLLGDEDMWGSHRWDMSSYPDCESSFVLKNIEGWDS